MTHPCSSSLCVHEVQFDDEPSCFYHTPPVMIDHNCVVEGCGKYGQAQRLNIALREAERTELRAHRHDAIMARHAIRQEAELQAFLVSDEAF
jgi:hypothetical protein